MERDTKVVEQDLKNIAAQSPLLNPPKNYLIRGGTGIFLKYLPTLHHVAFIVDSSKSNQGLYAPSSGIPIVAPPELKKSSSVKCVVVMGGSFTQEIVESLSANFSNTLKIITIDGTKLVELK